MFQWNCLFSYCSVFTFETLFFLIATQTPYSPVFFLSLWVPQSSLPYSSFSIHPLTLFLFTPSFWAILLTAMASEISVMFSPQLTLWPSQSSLGWRTVNTPPICSWSASLSCLEFTSVETFKTEFSFPYPPKFVLFCVPYFNEWHHHLT